MLRITNRPTGRYDLNLLLLTKNQASVKRRLAKTLASIQENNMSEEQKPFLTLGKSKFSKVVNTIVLILLLGFAAVKLGLISPSVTTGFEYTISANELQVQTQEELAAKLGGYSINMGALEEELKKIGIGLSEFKENVAMDIIISANQTGLNGLVIEFKSSLARETLEPIYNYIANDIKSYVKNKKG